MGIERFFRREVWRLRAPETTDRYGNPVRDWDNATRTRMRGWVYHTDSIETATAAAVDTGSTRDVAVSAWKLDLPKGSDVLRSDRFEIDGDVFEVNGKPRTLHTTRGPHHIQVSLREVEG